MRRFFTQQTLQENTEIQLCEQSFQHWVKVLRAKVGDQVVLFNGSGGEYHATLSSLDKKNATVSIGAFNPINRCNSFDTTLALVMSKGDRMDYALQKATEMGVTTIQLLTSDRCEVKLTNERLEKKLKSWQGIIVSACEQSGLNIIPLLNAPIPLKKYLNSDDENHLTKHKLVLAPSDNTNVHIPFDQKDTEHQHFCLLIGAEGGLTQEEVLLANHMGFASWCLGERVMRTETAPIAAIAQLQLYQQLNTHKI